MQIVESRADAFDGLKVVHGDKEIYWDLKFYSNPKNATVNSVFEYINGYWQSLPANRQADIFHAYERIQEVIEGVVDPNMLHVRLTNEVDKLYKLMPHDEVREWLIKNVNIRVPPIIKEHYNQLEIAERNQTKTDYKARTYLREDYLELVYVAVALKAMIPIWSEYAKQLNYTQDTNSFREYQCFSLLKKTNVVKSPAIAQLQTYIQTNNPEAKSQMSAALGGLGSSEMPDWLMSLAVIRKLVIIKLSSLENNDNIISVVYHHVGNSIKSLERKFTGRIKDKSKPSGSEDDESKSIVETYKIKQEISDGDLAVLSVYSEKPGDMLVEIDPTVPKEMLGLCLDYCRNDFQQSRQPAKCQLVLLRWLMSPVLSPRSIDNINKVSLLTCFGVGQSLLWHWGFPDLALILTSSETRDANGMFLGGIESRTRIPNDDVELFEQLYPHTYEKKTKERERQSNLTCLAIDDLAKEIVRCDWKTHSPPELMRLSENVDESGVMNAPSDIRIQLSKLVLKIAGNQ